MATAPLLLRPRSSRFVSRLSTIRHKLDKRVAAPLLQSAIPPPAPPTVAHKAPAGESRTPGPAAARPVRVAAPAAARPRRDGDVQMLGVPTLPVALVPGRERGVRRGHERRRPGGGGGSDRSIERSRSPSVDRAEEPRTRGIRGYDRGLEHVGAAGKRYRTGTTVFLESRGRRGASLTPCSCLPASRGQA